MATPSSMFVDVDDMAQSLVFKTTDGYIFITHDGKMVGPEPDRETMVAKAALYLCSIKVD